jgi:hypothetical protein
MILVLDLALAWMAWVLLMIGLSLWHDRSVRRAWRDKSLWMTLIKSGALRKEDSCGVRNVSP